MSSKDDLKESPETTPHESKTLFDIWTGFSKDLKIFIFGTPFADPNSDDEGYDTNSDYGSDGDGDDEDDTNSDDEGYDTNSNYGIDGDGDNDSNNDSNNSANNDGYRTPEASTIIINHNTPPYSIPSQEENYLGLDELMMPENSLFSSISSNDSDS